LCTAAKLGADRKSRLQVKGGSSDAVSVLLSAKTLDFLKFMVSAWIMGEGG